MIYPNPLTLLIFLSVQLIQKYHSCSFNTMCSFMIPLEYTLPGPGGPCPKGSLPGGSYPKGSLPGGPQSKRPFQGDRIPVKSWGYWEGEGGGGIRGGEGGRQVGQEAEEEINYLMYILQQTTPTPYLDGIDYSLLDQTFHRIKTDYVIPLDVRIVKIYILMGWLCHMTTT